MHHLGLTRSAQRSHYLLQTPDAFVRTPMPGLQDGAAIVHAAPQMGADFAMTSVELAAGGRLGAGSTQRFAYVLSGAVSLEYTGAAAAVALQPGGFAYLPEAHEHTLTATESSRLLLFEKHYLPRSPAEHGADPHAAPEALVGDEAAIPPQALNGDEGVQVRCLLPASPAFDFAINTMTYQPGASLAQVEIHYMEHGLLMLEGGGLYRLGDDWHPVTAGDAVWMGPFCPQWFAALGKAPARYILFKDVNRHVLG